MWKAIKVMPNEDANTADIEIGAERGGGKIAALAKESADSYNASKVKPSKEGKTFTISSYYGSGYWFLRWYDQYEVNEFGPVSP